MSDFGESFIVVGRKDYRCEWCGEKILKGERHHQYRGIWQNEWQNWRMHNECWGGHQTNYDPDGFTPFQAERPKAETTVN